MTWIDVTHYLTIRGPYRPPFRFARKSRGERGLAPNLPSSTDTAATPAMVGQGQIMLMLRIAEAADSLCLCSCLCSINLCFY